MTAAPEPTVYLVTGANRGIGLGLTTSLLSRPNTVVIATIRDPSSASAQALLNLPTSESSKLILQRINSLSQTDAQTCAKTLQRDHDIHKLDVLIANAGTGSVYGAAVDVPIGEYATHYQINTIAPLCLFQAFWPLLRHASPSPPKFVATSSRLASIEQLDFWAAQQPGDALREWMPAAPYGSSKAALNYLLRRLHFEHAAEGLVVFPLSPGWVATETGDLGARRRGLERAPVGVAVAVRGMLEKIDDATRENYSGRFVSFDDAVYPW